MRKVTVLIVLVFFISCKKEHDEKDTITANNSFNNELYSKILEFQNKIKVVNKSKNNSNNVKTIESALIYIYEIKFYIEDKDTIVGFTLYSGGINSYYNEDIKDNKNIYGIYENGKLQPTYVNDPLKIGKFFVEDYKENSYYISKFYQTNDFINDEIYDIHLYKVRGNKLIFEKIEVGNKR